MISYAGIGSRTITIDEAKAIQRVANKLAQLNYILYSGNAPGSDINFQIGSNNKCVLFLPWKDFNTKEYDVTRSIDRCVVGDTKDGLKSVEDFHPAPKSLSRAGRSLMCRNYHQVVGYQTYPSISFVICCANYTLVEDKMKVEGGTGQAVRIANSKNIPVFNIRCDNWLNKLKDLLEFNKQFS